MFTEHQRQALLLLRTKPLLRDKGGNGHDGNGTRIEGKTIRSLAEWGLAALDPFSGPCGTIRITHKGEQMALDLIASGSVVANSGRVFHQP